MASTTPGSAYGSSAIRLSTLTTGPGRHTMKYANGIASAVNTSAAAPASMKLLEKARIVTAWRNITST